MSVNVEVVGLKDDSVQFKLQGPRVLNHVPYVFIRQDDDTRRFSELANSFFADNRVAVLRIQKTETNDYVSIVLRKDSNISLRDTVRLGRIKDILKQAALRPKCILNEETLIASANADVPAAEKLTGLVAAFIKKSVLPELKRATGHTDAEIRVVRLIPRPDNAKIMDLGITLHSSCATCTGTVLADLNFTARAVQKNIFSVHAEKLGGREVGGVIVLPTKSGSPSFTHRPPRSVIFAEPKPLSA